MDIGFCLDIKVMFSFRQTESSARIHFEISFVKFDDILFVNSISYSTYNAII